MLRLKAYFSFGVVIFLVFISLIVQQKTTAVQTTPTPSPSGNCAISLNGQSFYISGGGGGVTTDPAIYETNWMPADWNPVTNYVSNQVSHLNPTENVAILIADDFRGQAPDEIFSDNPDEGSLPQANTPPVNRFSHGLLVYHHINYLLEQLGYTLDASLSRSTPPLRSAWQKSSSPLYLYVEEVDSADPNKGGYDVNVIQDHIKQTIDDLRGNNGVTRFVVNMSFSILPCNTVEDFENEVRTTGITFQDYATKVLNDPDISRFADWLREQATTQVFDPSNPTGNDNDLLYSFIQNNPDIVFISSAGNFGDILGQANPPFYFYPGAWDSVINVGGLEGDPMLDTWWPMSNLGEVKLPAAWYEYVIQVGTGTPPPPHQYYYAGTSFAAPVMSVIAALYQSGIDATTGIVPCPFETLPPIFASTPGTDPTSVPTFDDNRQMLGCP